LGIAALLPAQTTFVDVAAGAGVLMNSFGRGSAMVDLDLDGRLDLVLANAGMRNAVFQQQSDGTFVDMSAPWGIGNDPRASWASLVADFDNDGDPDIFFPNRGGSGGGTETAQLLRNDLRRLGTFTDVSAASGAAATQPLMSFGGTTLDYDRDGLLDIFVSNVDGLGCNLLHNEGNLRFTDVSVAAGITFNNGNYRHCSTGDINNDGWADIVVGNMVGENLVYQNNQDGTFTNVAAAVGLASPVLNFGLVLADFDNDGWMDAYIPKWQSGTACNGCAGSTMGLPGVLPDPQPSPLLLNNGDGTFRDVTLNSGMTWQTDMGHNVADVDADGYPDIYVGTGSPAVLADDRLFLITPDGSGGLLATDASSTAGIVNGGPTRCHGIAFGDYDGDGDIDVYCNNGGPQEFLPTKQTNFLWQNQGNGRYWLAVDLKSVLSNGSAVGARSAVVMQSGRRIHRWLSAGHGFGNTDSPTQNFGLGGDAQVDRLEIWWPSGIRQTRSNLQANTRIQVTETGILPVAEPVSGQKWSGAVAGPPNSGATIMVSDAVDSPASTIPGADFRNLLHPVQVGSIKLDDRGRGEFSIPMPEDPAMVGITVHVQAWIHAADDLERGTLSNVVSDTIRAGS